MRYFVVTHQPIEWTLPDFMEPVSTVPCGGDVVDLSAEYPQFSGRGPQLSEYATLFALRRLLEESQQGSGLPAEDEMIGVAHYRRYPVTRPIGIPSDVYGVLTPAEFETLGDEAFLPEPGTLLLPRILTGTSMLEQYNSSHGVRDLLHFMGLAADLGVIHERAAASFLAHKVMVPACTVGVYPARWYLDVLARLERVAEAFESTVARTAEGYQSRATAFCCERLHSMLLAQLTSQYEADRVLVNPAVIVSRDGVYQPLQGAA